MKIKLSSMLLIGLIIAIVGGLFASNYMLKQAYLRKIQEKDYPYTQLCTQPFKHLKIVQGASETYVYLPNPPNYGSISITNSNTFSVLFNASNWRKGAKDSIHTEFSGDTLIIKPKQFSQSSFDEDLAFELQITAPKISSITCVNSSVNMSNLNQEDIEINAFGNSHFTLSRNGKTPFNMRFIKAKLNDKTTLELDSLLTINTLDVILKNKAKLSLPNTPVEHFKFKADKGTSIKANSELFKLN